MSISIKFSWPTTSLYHTRYFNYNGRRLKRLIVRKLRTFRKSLLYWYFKYDEFTIQITFIKCMMNWLYILDDNPSNQIRAIIKLRLVVNLNRISFLLPTKITQIDRFQKMEFQNLKLYICTRNRTILGSSWLSWYYSRSNSLVRTYQTYEPNSGQDLETQNVENFDSKASFFLIKWHVFRFLAQTLHLSTCTCFWKTRNQRYKIKKTRTNAILFQRQSLKTDF